MNSLGERIAFLRESKRLSQRQLMDTLEFSNLGRFEKNERKPGIEIITSLADFFDVSTDWLLNGKEKVSDVKRHQQEISGHDLELLAKIHQLTDPEKLKIEGMIDGLLLSHELNSAPRNKSTHSKTINEGDHAAASETA